MKRMRHRYIVYVISNQRLIQCSVSDKSWCSEDVCIIEARLAVRLMDKERGGVHAYLITYHYP